MGFIGLLAIAVGLSMDAFAVSLCKGMCMKSFDVRQALIIALFFGVFQAFMPIVGWLAGSTFAAYIEPIDHWVAFILLAIIGLKMIIDAIRDDSANECFPDAVQLKLSELIILAIATSIDALAVGVTFAFLGVDIVSSASIIGVTTFALSLIGVMIGQKFGSAFERGAGMLGGIILILIGLKILLEHLGIF